ncbi:hypothetical protein EHQ61_00835 [Leptospira wolffii]|uniref:hypothetical protein n=1 Tax=Leptospira wolffii TaxID=409998 RepID=UPI001082ACD1|nr:hypothetical protein [Leptospira wolffii]TGL54564.1 hypothetical protein EHQ61_00835 [Leptospira wolffii]
MGTKKIGFSLIRKTCYTYCPIEKKMKRIPIYFFVLLIALQFHCGTYLLFDSNEKRSKSETDRSPLLSLLIGSDGLPPLNVEPISWVNFSTNTLQFSKGASDQFTISVDHPGGCPDAGFLAQLSSDGVPLTFLDGTDLWTDGCPINTVFDQTFNITGTVTGNGRVIVQLSPFMLYTAFPDLHVGQIIGVVNVTVLPTVSTAQTR